MKNAKLEFYRDIVGEYRWRIIAANGNILCVSSEGYKTKQGCEKGLKAVIAFFDYNLKNNRMKEIFS
jgi:uncharacterized protein